MSNHVQLTACVDQSIEAPFLLINKF